ncbi:MULTISPECIES: AAA family ATPase [Halocatena]|uniref:AAA family ATPase n=2 Tax=Halocatena TaxID=2907493 RepID=A0A8U0A919_9EURY|nr:MULTISPECIES: AAA family ATPase [Halocatena]RRJ28731.1 AAA family ATPase [Halocatena pleomorpha]UPM45326.1 AAA family ATPase [Halocatena salina]
MADTTHFTRDDFEQLGTTKSNLQSIRRHLQQIGEDVYNRAPKQFQNISSDPTASRIRPQHTEKDYREYMWTMYGRAGDDRGPHELVHPEFLIGEDDDGPFVDVRFNAGTAGDATPVADQRETLKTNIGEQSETFLTILSQFDDATVSYQPKYGNSYSMPVDEFTGDDIDRLAANGITRFAAKRRYREADGIFNTSFIDIIAETFADVLFPLLGFARDDVPECVIRYAETGDLTRGSEESSEKPERADDIARQLETTKQVVFYGPPGTGKTYSANQFAEWWVSEGPPVTTSMSQVHIVTFHPSFSYEDFVEGLSAEATDSGTVNYDISPGRFKRVCEAAQEAYEMVSKKETPPRFVLIIDEINRGNLAQIFGETITQLEADKRRDEANEVQVQLAHSGESFVVPPNLFVIGTMNTADRSIALVDAALRRRFRFINFPPDYDALYEEYNFDHKRDVHATAESGASLRALLALSLLALEELNERIRSLPDLGKGKQIGHSYLFGCTRDDGQIDEDALVDTWKYEILPLLEEYYFGQFERIEQDLLAGTDDRLVDWRTKQIKDFTADDLHTALASLLNIEPETTSRQTVDILSENGVLEAGDILEFNREQLRNGTTVSDTDIERAVAERDAAFWQSEVIDATAESGDIRWLNDGDLYSLSGAAQQIFDELTNGDETTVGQPDHWCHPQFNDRNLYQLRDNGVAGTDRSVSTE